MSNYPINVDRARYLYGVLKDWREVGRVLANEEWRPAPYQGYSVRNAVSNWRRNMNDFTQIQQLPRIRCHFDVVLPCPVPGVVAIVDQNDGAISVTNDAENVVRRLVTLGMLRAGDRLIYRDSEGDWAEIKWTHTTDGSCSIQFFMFDDRLTEIFTNWRQS